MKAGPVIAVNTAMHYRAGSVGRLMTGITARLDDVPGIPRVAVCRYVARISWPVT